MWVVDCGIVNKCIVYKVNEIDHEEIYIRIRNGMGIKYLIRLED